MRTKNELVKGLAAHMLVDLNIRVKSSNAFTNSKSLLNDIALLITATHNNQCRTDIRAMLENFNVGTDRSKQHRGSPSNDSIRPLRLCKHEFPSTKMLNVIKIEQKEDPRNDESDSPNLENYECDSNYELNY